MLSASIVNRRRDRKDNKSTGNWLGQNWEIFLVSRKRKKRYSIPSAICLVFLIIIVFLLIIRAVHRHDRGQVSSFIQAILAPT